MKQSNQNQRKLLFFLVLIVMWSDPLDALNRSSSAPFISGDTFRAAADWIYDELTTFDTRYVKPGDIVFVKTDYLSNFFEKYHVNIASPYILVTHNSDDPIPGRFAAYLDEGKIVAWFGQNVENYVHPKLHPIPIGIANQCWPHGNIHLFKEVMKLLPGVKKNILLYMNFQVVTRPDERSYVYHLFQGKPYCVKSAPKQLFEYLLEMSQAKFVLSPRGNGLDTHRTWEALLMGAIPIVKRSSMDSLFLDQPVLLIDDWSEINEEFLDAAYAELSKNKHEKERIFSSYWIEQILFTKETFLNDHYAD